MIKDNSLLMHLEAMSSEQLDDLDYGVIRMSIDGVVTDYNRAEQQLSGLDKQQVIGRHFFTEVALCTNNLMVAQKYLDKDELNEALDYIFTLRMSPTAVALQLLKSKSAAHQYLPRVAVGGEVE